MESLFSIWILLPNDFKSRYLAMALILLAVDSTTNLYIPGARVSARAMFCVGGCSTFPPAELKLSEGNELELVSCKGVVSLTRGVDSLTAFLL